ncbi:MAG TPA: GNAT family N-acetyltransferase [Chryseosolibacter sp.]|nr:GNAT family N-acetyltransferase [Chryseosolibacter sp.]
MNVVRIARPSEYAGIGNLLVEVYSQLVDFPKPDEQPAYYKLLANVGALTEKPGVEILVAENGNSISGAVVYFNDMTFYGSGGTATKEMSAAGFRLLGVRPQARGIGVGKSLTNACIDKARSSGKKELIIHTTNAMKTAWKMYERMGFERSPDLDFLQGSLEVFGFRKRLVNS